MLIGIFPSTCNSSGDKADIPVSTDLNLRVAKGHCQSVPGCKTSCGDAQPFKGFCLEPPEQPEPLSTDEDQWGWNLFWFRHSFYPVLIAQAETQNQVITYLQAGEFTPFIYSWLFPIPFIYAVVQCRRVVANTISIIILTRTEWLSLPFPRDSITHCCKTALKTGEVRWTVTWLLSPKTAFPCSR